MSVRRSEYFLQWRQLRDRAFLGSTSTLDKFIRGRPQEPEYDLETRDAYFMDWRQWRDENKDSRISLAEYVCKPPTSSKIASLLTSRQIEDIEKSRVVNTNFLTPRGYGPEVEIPLELNILLRKYQLQGIYWLNREKPHGKILADDMGLGKTIQALAAVALLPKRSNGARQALIIVPRQVLRNWKNEIDRVYKPSTHAHAMAVIIVHGQEGQKPVDLTVEQLRGNDVVLTTPDTIYRQIRNYHAAATLIREGHSAKVPKTGFCLVGVEPPTNLSEAGNTKHLGPITSWQMIILDEAHVIRTHKGAVVANLNMLKADRKLALTGTPISNTPEDVFNILSFIEDDSGKDFNTFRDEVVQPIVKRPNLGKPGGFEKDFAPLHAIFRRCLLRRDKSMTIDGASIVSLQKKTIFKHLAKFTDLEEKIYEATFNMGKSEYEKYSNEGKTIAAGAGKFPFILVNFLRLRQACCAPALLLEASKAYASQQTSARGEEDDDEDPKEVLDAQYSISTELKRLCESAEKDSLVPAKTRVLMDILDRTYARNSEAKVLIFTEWTKHLHHLIAQLKSRGYNFLPFHGGLSPADRDEAQQKYFADGINGLVLTFGAGGVGLNLVMANLVVLMSPPWNPQRDAQAMDRAYRIGQDRDVEVHHIYALSMELRSGYAWKTLPTIEDVIQRKQAVKLDFFAGSYGQEHTENSQGGMSTDPGEKDAQRMYETSRFLRSREPSDLEVQALRDVETSAQALSESDALSNAFHEFAEAYLPDFE